jgi:hypothetical protein
VKTTQAVTHGQAGQPAGWLPAGLRRPLSLPLAAGPRPVSPELVAAQRHFSSPTQLGTQLVCWCGHGSVACGRLPAVARTLAGARHELASWSLVCSRLPCSLLMRVISCTCCCWLALAILPLELPSVGASSEAGAEPLSADFYRRLGVTPSATGREIAKAYRTLALLHHPDKNADDKAGAEERFVAIAEAYETLSDPAKRKQYDSTGAAAAPAGSSRRGGRGFDFGAAEELFRSSFGEVVWKQWRPGKTVSGTIKRDGRVYSITINADGSSEEQETAQQDGNGGSNGRYAFVKSTGGGGGVSYQLSIDGGSLGEALSELLVPGWLTALPGIGAAVMMMVSWLPTILLGWCVLSCCRPR